MKRNLLFLFFLFSLIVPAQNNLYEHYIERYAPMAVQQQKLHGIPASITLAQALLESGAGTSFLAQKANNHFGIKTGGTWKGPYVTKDDDRPGERFRKYNSPTESYEDHSQFLLTRQRYASLFQLDPTDYKGWAHGLKSAGYATNPEYANKLISLIEIYKLHRFDKQQPAAIEQIQPQKEKKEKKHERRKKKEEIQKPLQVRQCNGHYFVVARAGDNFNTIAHELKANAARLRKYNEVNELYQLHEGSIVYLEKKSRRVAPEMRGRVHTVAAGESLYTIAQRYGIRIRSLYKANRLAPTYVPREGDRLLLR